VETGQERLSERRREKCCSESQVADADTGKLLTFFRLIESIRYCKDEMGIFFSLS